jgi:hypothetical protein
VLLFSALRLVFIDGNSMIHSSNHIAMNGPVTKISILLTIIDEFHFRKAAEL